MNIEKMNEARKLLDQVDTLFSEAGVYTDENGLACAFSLREVIEDLDTDIARAEGGLFD